MNFKPTQKKLRFLAQTCAACQKRNLCTANAARKVRRQASRIGHGKGQKGVWGMWHGASGNRRSVINCKQASMSVMGMWIGNGETRFDVNYFFLVVAKTKATKIMAIKLQSDI